MSWHWRQVASRFSAASFFREGPGTLLPSIWPFMCAVALAESWQDTQPCSREARGVCLMPVAAASWQLRHAVVSTAGVAGPLVSSAARAHPAAARRSTPAIETRAAVVLIHVSVQCAATGRSRDGPVGSRAVQRLANVLDHQPLESVVATE